MLQCAPEIAGFQLTATRPCSYLPGRTERMLFTWANDGSGSELYDRLTKYGFRRSRGVFYRPSCPQCSACISARVDVNEFTASRSQRRAARANASLKREIAAPADDSEAFELFRAYVLARHGGGGMDGMNSRDFKQMVDDAPVRTCMIKYSGTAEGGEGQTLFAAALTDLLSDGLSMLYSFFDPSHSKRSLGTFMILDHIDLAKAHGLKYVYLGYWVPGSAKMGYKERFSGLEVYVGRAWRPLSDLKACSRTAVSRSGAASPMLP